MAKTYRASYFYTSSNYSSQVDLSSLTATPVSMPVSSTYYVYMLMTCYDGDDFEDYCNTRVPSSEEYAPRAISYNTGYVTVGSLSNVTVCSDAENTFSAVKFTVTSTSSAAGTSTPVYTEDCQYQQLGDDTWFGCSTTEKFYVSVNAATTYSITVDPQWTSSSYGYLYMDEPYDIYAKVSGSDGSTPKPTVTSSSTSYATVAISSSTYTHNSSSGWYKITITPKSTSPLTSKCYVTVRYSGATTQHTYFRIYAARSTDSITLHSNTSSPLYWTYSSSGSNMFFIYAKAASGQQIYFQSYDTSKAICDTTGTYVSSGTYAGYYRSNVTCKATTSSSGMFFNVYTNGNTTYKPTSITPTAYIRSILTNPTASGSYTYTGSLQSVSVSNAPSSTIATTSGTFSATNAGSYTCSYTIKDSNMYVFANGESVTELNWAIAKASQTITPHAALSGKVSSSGSAASTASSGLACTYSSSNTAVATVNASTGAVSYVGEGTCAIYVNQAGNSNYNAAAQKSVAVTVSKNILTVTADKTSWNYDGSTHIPTFTYSTTYVSQSGTTTAQSAADTYTTTFTIYEASRNAYVFDDGEYTKSISWTINKVAPTYTAPAVKSGGTYNGSAQAIGNAGSATGGTMYYQWGNANGPLQGTWQSNIANVTRTDTGTYYLWYYVAGDKNHTSTSSAKVATAFVISKATPSFTKTDGNSTYPNGATGYVKASVAGTVYYGTSTSSMTTTAAAAANTNVAIASVAANSAYNTSATRYAIFVPTDTTNYNSVGSASSGYLTVTAKVAYKAAGYISGLDISDLNYTSPNSSDATVATQSGTLTYNGSSQSPTWKSGNYSNDPTGGTSSATNAGTYSQTVSLKNTVYFRGSSSTRSITGASGTVTYASNNTNVATVAKDSSSGAIVTFVGAGTATITVSVAESTNYNATSTSFTVQVANGKHIWSDGTTADKTVYWTINNHAGTGSASESSLSYTSVNYPFIATPTQSNSLTYNAASQSPTFNNDTNYCTISGGTASATNAGDYSRTASLTNAAYFASGTKTFTISGNSGTLGTPTTSDQNVATASLSSSTVTVTFKKAGSATISVPVAAATNYDATTISVSVSSKNGKCIWFDGTTAAKPVTWKINKANQTAPTATGATVDYDSTATATASGGGGQGTLTWTNGSTRSALGSQTTKAYWAGNSNYNASGYSNEVTLTVNTRSITITADNQSKTYDGKALTAANTATVTSGSLLSGHTISVTCTGSQTNAGSSTKTLSTAKVMNGTTDVSEYYTITKANGTLSVSRASGSLSLSPTSGTITYSSTTATFTITRSGDGAITATSSNNNIATVSVSGTTATVTRKGYGSATITVSVAQGTNYTAPANKTYTVTCAKATNGFAIATNSPVYGSGNNMIKVTTATSENAAYYAVDVQLTSSNYSTAGSTTIPTATSSLNAVAHTVYYYIPEGTNYNAKSGSVSVTISKATGTITASNKSVNVYGTVAIGATSNSGGTLTYSSASTGVATVNTSGTITGVTAGTAKITITLAATTNYTSATKDISATVSRTQVAVPTATGTAKTYNGSSQGPTFTYDSTKVDISGTTTATNANTSSTPKYTAIFTVKDNVGYVFTNGSDSYSIDWTIAKANQTWTLSVGKTALTSGDSTTYSISGTTYGIVQDSVSPTTYASLNGTTITVSGSPLGNTTALTVTYPGNDNYNSRTQTATITLYTKIDTPTPNTMIYSGGSQTASFSGVANCSATAGNTGTNAGSYTATFTTSDSSKYRFPGAATTKTVDWSISKRPININGNTASGTYRGSNYSASGGTAEATDTNRGLASGHGMTSCGGSVSRKDVGTSTYTPSSAVISDANGADRTSNYNITYVANSGSVTVSAKAVTIAGKTNSKTYDGTALTVSGGTASGLVSGHTLASCDGSVSRTAAGTSNYTPSNAVIKDSDGNTVTTNYSISYTANSGAVTINKAAVTPGAPSAITNRTYTAVAQTIMQAGSTAGGTYYYGPASATCTSTSLLTGTNAGNYPIYWKWVADANHTGTTEPAKLATEGKINKRSLTVAANNNSKTWGANDPTLQYTFNSVSYNSGASFPTGYGSDKVTINLSRAAGTNVGSYDITGSQADQPANYTVTVTKGTFSINKAEITSVATPTAANPTYNGGDLNLVTNGGTSYGSYSYSSSSTGTYAADFMRKDRASSGYTVYWKFTPDSNHQLKSAITSSGSITANVAQRALTVSAVDKAKNYGAGDPTLQYTFGSGTYNSDTAFSTGYSTDTLTVTLSRASGEAAGTYNITGTVSSNINYSVTVNTATFTINKVAGSFTNPTAANPTYNGNAKAYANAATNVVGGKVQYSTSSTGTYSDSLPTSTNAGTYTLYWKFVPDGNHTIPSNGTGSVTCHIARATPTFSKIDGTAKYPNTASGVVAATVAGTVYYGTSSSSMTSTEAATADTGVTIVTRTSSSNIGTSTVYAYFVPTDTTNYNSVGSSSSYALSVTATTTVGIVSLPNTTTESKAYIGVSQSPTYTASKTGMTTSGDTSKTNAGSYTITYTLTSTTNYKWFDNTTAAKTKSWSITAVSLGSISTPSDSSYTGSAQTPTVTVKATVNGTSTTLTADTDYTLSYSNNTNAGTATVTATGKGNFSGTKSANWTINRIAQPGTVTGKSASYGGSGALAAASNVAGSASVYYAVGTQLTDSNYSTAGSTTVPTASGRNASDYTVYYYIPQVTNYLKKSGSVTGTVAKVPATVTKLPAINTAVTYDGSAYAIGTAGTASGGTLYYTYGTADAAQGSWSTSIPTATNWRSNGYYLWAKVTADGNHTDIAAFKTDSAFMINKAAITVTAPAANTLSYNGSAQILCTTGTTTNGTMKYAAVTKGSTAPAESSYSTSRPTASQAGDYTVYWKFEIDSNHSTTSTVSSHFDVNIAKIDATLTLTQYAQDASVGQQIKVSDFVDTSVPNVTLTYKITTNGTTTDSTISGSTVTIGGMSTANDSNQTVVVTVTNPGNGNYNAHSVTYTITAKKKAQLAPTATGATTTYPTVANASYTDSTIHVGTLTWTTGSSRSAAGEQSTQAYYARTNAYAESPKSSAVTLKVNPRTVTATMPTIASDKQWDNASSNTSTGGSVTAGGTMYYYQSTSSTTPAWDVRKWITTRPSAKTVDTYYLWAYAYVSDTTNNTASTNTNTVKYIGKYTITKRVLSIAWGTVTWTYDGTTHQADPVVSNKVDGYSCTVSYSGNSIKNAGTTTVTASIPTTDAGYAYYRLPSNYQATLTINKRSTTTTITPSATSFTYGGTAATYTYADSNLAANQTATHMSENNPASTSTVGSYTVNSVTVIKDANGNDVTSNYNITEGSTKVSVTIRTVSVTVPTAKSGTFTYNAGNQTLFNAGSASAGGTMYYKVTTSSTKPSFVKNEWSTSVPSSKAAGTYYLWYYVLVSDTTNNTYASQNTVLPASGTISKSIAVATVASPNTTTESFEYKKEQITPAYTRATTGMYLDTNSVTSATNAGNYTITYKLTDSNYKWSDDTTADKTKSWSITKKEVTLTWNSTRSWVYDGSAHSISATVVTAGGLISGDTCTVGTTGNSVGPNVGTATVTANTLSNNNYKLPAANTTTISITKKELTVTASSHSVTYGDAKPTLSITYTGFVGSEDKSVLDKEPTIATNYTTTTNVANSPVPVTLSGGSDNNYSYKFVNGNITINKKQLTVTASSHTVTYGDAKPTLSVSYSGWVNSQGTGSLTTAPTASTTYTSSTSVSASPVATTASGGAAANYSFKYVDGKITINKKATDVVVTGGGTYNYDAKAHNIHATASPAIAGKIYYGLAPDNLAYNTSVGAGSTGVDIGGIIDVGSVSRFVQFVPTDTTNYSSSAVKGEYVVTINAVKATLPTTWAGDSKYFHETATVSASGQIGGTIYYRSSTTSATSGYGSWTTTKPTREAVGTTWVQCYVKADTNHTDSSVSDAVTLTINRVDDAAMTVTLANNLTYNGADQTIVTTSNAHGISHFYVGLSTDGTTPPVDGAWSTDPATIKKTAAGDYYVWYKFTADSSHSTVKNATYVGKVTIARRATTTTITPSATSYIYGNAAPTYTYADSNLATNHTATHTASNAPGALTDYTGSGITVTATTVIKDANGNNVTSNYTVTNGTCTVTVNRRPIVINAPVNANATYTGSAQYYCTTGSITANLPDGATSTGTWTYGTSSSSLTANRPQKTDAGTYTMYWKFDIGNNYYEQDHAPTTRAESGSVDGTIKQKAATITVNRSAASHVYGNTAVTYTFTTSGLVNSTDLGTITASGAPASKSTVGSYSVGASYTANSNYSVTVTKASVSVTARPITITGGTKSKAYDGTILTYNSASLTSGSLASGDTATYSSANGTTNKPIHVADGEITNVPSVVIVSGSTDVTTNYSITKTNGKLSITKAANGMTTSKVTLTKYVNASVDISGYSANAIGAVNYAINTSSTTTSNVTCNAETGAVTVGVCSTSDDTDKKTVLTITAAGSGDYNSATRTVEITVQKYVPTITWDNNTTNLTYGNTLSVKASATATGGTVGTLSYSTVGNYTTISGSTLTGKQYSNQDSDTITCSVSRTSTVKAGSTTRSIVVTKRTVTLTWGTKSWPYDGKAHGTTCTAGNLVGSDTCTVTLSGNSVTNYSATATTVTATALSNTNYVLPSTGTTTSISITKVELTVTGASQTVTYATPVATVQSGLYCMITGFVNGETKSVLTTQPSMETNYTATTNALTTGIYSRPSGAAATNYSFKYVDGTITINKAAGSANFDISDWNYTSPNSAVLTAPTQNNSLTYIAGTEQSPTWSYGSYSSAYITVDGSTSGDATKAINAGNYKMTAKLANKAYFTGNSALRSATSLTGAIDQTKLASSDATVATVSLANSSTVQVSFLKAGSTTITIPIKESTNYNATTVTINVTVANGKYIWSDGTTAAKRVSWEIKRQKLVISGYSNITYTSPDSATLAKPTQNGTLTYNGSAQSPKWSNTHASISIPSVSGKNAETFTTTATLTGAKTYFAVKEDIVHSISVSASSVITITDGDSTICRTSYDTPKSTSVDITYHLLKAGTTTVSIVAEPTDLDNYEAAGATVHVVTANGQYIWSDKTTAPKSITWKIDPKSVTLTWGVTSWKYDATKHGTSCTANNVVSGDTCNVTLTGNSVGEAVGTATVSATALSNTNYTFSTSAVKSKTLEITPGAYIYDTGSNTWKPVKEIYAWDGTSWKRTKHNIYSDSTWKE